MSDRLLIVGNGFDIAHGLHSDYRDFRNYLEGNHPEFLIEFEKMYNAYQIDNDGPCSEKDGGKKPEPDLKNILWSAFEDNMGKPDIGEMLALYESVMQDIDLDEENIGIQDTMDIYWRKQFGFVKQLEGYVKEWIEQISTNGVKPKKSTLINDNDCLFLNFNYTDTLENVYHINSVFHIHGSVGENSLMNPIIGHCNITAIEEHREAKRKAEERFDEGEASIQNAVVDYLKSIYKDTSRIIDKSYFFFNKLNKVKDITVFGWSAGSVDIPYLKKISESADSEAVWHVYWYNEEAKKMLEDAFNQVGIKEEFRDFNKTEDYWDKE